MKCPETITFRNSSGDPIEYSVTQRKKPIKDRWYVRLMNTMSFVRNRKGYWGRIDNRERTIDIYMNKEWETTLVHEITHGIFYQNPVLYRLMTINEELFVEAWANMFTRTLMNNGFFENTKASTD